MRVNQLSGSAEVAVDWVGARDDVDFRDFPATRITLPSYGVVSASLSVGWESPLLLKGMPQC